MSVIPESQLQLMRQRKLLASLLEQGNFKELLTCEVELTNYLNLAVNDPQRSSRDLFREVSRVVKLYGRMASACQLMQGSAPA